MVGKYTQAMLFPYAEQLFKLRDERGPEMMILVKCVIITKLLIEHLSVSFEVFDEREREEQGQLIVQAISEVIGSMCTLAGKDFQAEVSPLVAEIMSTSIEKQSIQ